MHLKNVVSQDEANKSVTLLLYGRIGETIDGDHFAQEITYLSEQYDEIVIRINSEGGSVLQGLSIFNAMLNSKAFIIACIDGVAASMAGVIAMAADLIRMNDFARIMVHNPLIPGLKNLSKKEIKTLDNIRDMLTDLLSRRGIDKAVMSDFMSKETWFKAGDALAIGLIDEIIPTNKADLVNNSLADIAAISGEHFMNFIDNIPKKQDMKLIAALFGLTAQADEAEVISNIKALQTENATLQGKLTELKALADELKTRNDAQQTKAVEALVDGAIKNGFFAIEQRADLIAMGQASFETFSKTIDGLKKPAAQSLANILSQANGGEQGAEKHDFEWYRKNDPQALTEMKTLEPERFAKLYEAWAKE